MKKLMSLGVLMALVIVIGVLAGCSTTSVTTLDKEGKPVIIENFKGDAIGMISHNLKDKLVLISTDGTFVDFKITPPNSDNPTGTIEAVYAGGKKIYMTIPTGMELNKINLEGLAKVLMATSGKSVIVDSSGIKTSNEAPGQAQVPVTTPAAVGQ